MNLYQSLLVASKYAKQASSAPVIKARAQSIQNAGKGAEKRKAQGLQNVHEIYNFLADGKKVVANDVALKFGIHHTTATKHLRTLFEDGKIMRALKHLDGHTFTYWRVK